MNCSHCIKQDICQYRATIFEGFAGIIDNLFDPQNAVKKTEIEEFVFNICPKKFTHGQVENPTHLSSQK